jgi:hypothetical protein
MALSAAKSESVHLQELTESNDVESNRSLGEILRLELPMQCSLQLDSQSATRYA